MNLKTFAISAVVVAALGAPMTANAATFEPAAGYVTGHVTGLNEAAGTIVVEGITIKLSPGQLGDATLGSEVDVAYVMAGGRLTAIAVSPIEPGNDAEFVE